MTRKNPRQPFSFDDNRRPAHLAPLPDVDTIDSPVSLGRAMI